MDLGVDPLVLMSQMVTLIMDIIAGTKWLKPNMATKLEVLLQTGGYLLLSSYVYDTCQGSDAAVAVDAAGTASGESAATTVQKSGGWFGFISDAMEVVLE
ncbi:hypothetical protein HanPI659440_Chr11g0416971 [Helianthus annuus]|nr:hypothetical protein HanPI659440_Chr11g0416971 [Helianthus annuus]